MSFPRYERYKESGVEWLGEVPEGWEVLPLKRSFKIVGGSTPKSDQEAYWDGEVVWVTPSDLSKLQSLYISDSQRKITDNGLASCGVSLVPANSIILSTRAPIGSLAITNTEMCTNQGCKSLVPYSAADAKFYGYLLSNSSTELNIRGKGTTFLELSGDELGAFKLPFPPPPEQHTIAAFLDRETGKIDALVAEQERLIALLKENRQAVISHAVTKGLNPDAPMKDSGIEWLGVVPEGWEVRKLNRLSTKIGDGLHGTPIYVDESDYYFINGNNLMNGSILVTDATRRVAIEEYENHFIEMNDNTLLMSINGTVGNLACYDGEKIVLGKSAAYINCSERISRIFLSYYLLSSAIRTYIDCEVTGTTIFNFSLQSIRNLPTVVPPPKEQSAIVTFLDCETAKIDTLVGEAQQAISLLKERRSALISAAVTGKIDVRNSDRSDESDLSEGFCQTDLSEGFCQTP